MLLPKLVEKLKESGVDKKYFQPIISKSRPKRITEEGINNLKDVNKTYEFYDEYREIIISKKVAQIIKENVPYAKFYPVILDNRN